MVEDHKTLVTGILQESTEELFGFYETPVQRQELKYVRDLEMGFVGILGFTGGEVRGTVMLGLTDDILRLHCGLECGEAIPRSLARDWVGELANQLLGRLKNRLMPYGATIYLSTPVTLTGQRIMLLSSDTHCAIGPLVFRCGEEFVCVWLEYEVNEEHVWERSEEDAPLGSEGDLLMF
jgi:CheY-specific phosphatase CheX